MVHPSDVRDVVVLIMLDPIHLLYELQLLIRRLKMQLMPTSVRQMYARPAHRRPVGRWRNGPRQGLARSRDQGIPILVMIAAAVKAALVYCARLPEVKVMVWSPCATYHQTIRPSAPVMKIIAVLKGSTHSSTSAMVEPSALLLSPVIDWVGVDGVAASPAYWPLDPGAVAVGVSCDEQAPRFAM